MTRATGPDSVRMTNPAMRVFLLVASILVLVIGTPIFLLPAKSDVLFSWTVNPPVTAAFLGAGYLGSFLLEYLSSRQRVWARTRVAVPSVFVFTTVMLWVTLEHIDKFHLGNDVSWAPKTVAVVWLAVYAVVPVVMVILTIFQLRTPGADPPRVASLPRLMRFVLVVQAGALLFVGLGLLIEPVSVAENVWPWQLSALTARAGGAFLLGTGVVAAHSVLENDLTRLSGAMAAYCAFGFLELLVILRHASSLHPVTGEIVVDWTDPRSWIYVVFFLSLGVVGLWGLSAMRKVHRGLDAKADQVQ